MSNARNTDRSTSTGFAATLFAGLSGMLAALAALLRARGSAAPFFARLTLALLGATALLALAAPVAAQASFGFSRADLTFTAPDGSTQAQAGSHPGALTTTVALNTFLDPESGIEFPDGAAREVRIEPPPGLVGTPDPVPLCSATEFLQTEGDETACPDASVLGFAASEIGFSAPASTQLSPIYDLRAAPGEAAKFGFVVLGVPIVVDTRLNPDPPYNLISTVAGISQSVFVYGSVVTLWGVPADPAHDAQRGPCLGSSASCPVSIPEVPFLTLPTACTGPLASTFFARAWNSGASDELQPLTHDDSEPPSPLGITGCSKLGFSPSISARPTSRAASSPTGLDFSLDLADEGLTNPAGLAQSQIKKAVVTLPEGISVNPSIAAGLAVCSEAQLEAETAASPPGAGCPEASKIGSVEVETPLLHESLEGALYQAAPYQNPFGSLIALYVVIKNPTLGIKIVQPLKVESDPQTGRLTTVAEDLPQQPFSHFRLHFREGARSPLVTPPSCDADPSTPGNQPYTAEATLYPYSGGPPVTSSSAFEVISGPDNSPCPSGGLPPFHPELTAGTLNNAAGRFSPFDVKITRSDTEQEITHFSIKLPPGVAGKLAGIPFCSDAAIAAATARTGPHGGQEELDSPSCPAATQVGRSLAGSGVGPSLAYAPGKVYLAGPYHGHPVSFVAITAGVVGPFDIGTVVVRLALDVNPETGEVFLDSTGSDPIPHIIQGIPVHLRDIRAYTDRSDFTFNPTSCEPTSTSSTVLGSGLDFVSAADDNPFVATSRFQAADCAALPFKPKLTLKLIGQKKRAGNPALHAHLTMAGMGALGANEAGLAYSQVTLPKTLFLDNAHIGTVCTRVQFKEGATEGEKCPAGSVIGTAKAVTPILEAPLEGPIYLRSNPERELPDIAASLHGAEISVVAVAHTDSGKGGGLRSTFEVIPDAPITSVDVNLFGGHKGLIESSRNLCSYKPKATVKFKAHSGKAQNSKDPLKVPGCHGHKNKQNRSHRRRQQR